MLSDEWLAAVDENGVSIPAVRRSDAHAKGIWHRTAHVWVLLPDIDGGSLLFQRRSQSKDVAPGLLDVSVGGHLSPCEDPLDAALRELYEELGIHASPDRLAPLGTRRTAGMFAHLRDREFQSVFGLMVSGGVAQIHPDSREIAVVVPVPVDAGLAMFNGERAVIEVAEYVSPINIHAAPAPSHVSTNDFIPHSDGYYQRALSMARRWLRGEDDLAI